MTVDEMIEVAARTIWDHMDYGGVPSRMPQWLDQGPVTGAKYRRRAEAALKSLGLPLETLAALKAGTMKAVPVEPTDDMARPLTRSWLLAEQEPTAEDMHLARQYAAIMLAAAPAKPGDAE